MEGNIQNKLLRYGDVLMRVPLLFVIDELLRVGLGTAEESIALNATESGKGTVVRDVGLDSFSSVGQEPFLMQGLNLDSYFYENYLVTALKFVACCYG